VSDEGDGSALAGLGIVVFEARRAAELARMLERHGARIVPAPALREAPLPASAETRELARALDADDIAALLLLTGVGTKALATLLGDDVARLFARTRLVARGPKPLAALRELGIPGAVAVPSPNTWREVLATLDGLALPAGARIAVQEYGGPPTALLDGLAARGHRVLAVPVYRWALPADTTELTSALEAIVRGEVDVAVFTSATQVEHAFRVAPDPARLRGAFGRVVIASVGPVCSEALEAHGLAVDLESDPPKMGPLVALVAESARDLARRKRTG
jgi:uroporphyrinogen-III synthase